MYVYICSFFDALQREMQNNYMYVGHMQIPSTATGQCRSLETGVLIMATNSPQSCCDHPPILISCTSIIYTQGNNTHSRPTVFSLCMSFKVGQCSYKTPEWPHPRQPLDHLDKPRFPFEEVLRGNMLQQAKFKNIMQNNKTATHTHTACTFICTPDTYKVQFLI